MVIGLVTLLPSLIITVQDGLFECPMEHNLHLANHLLQTKEIILDAIHQADKLKLYYVSFIY